MRFSAFAAEAIEYDLAAEYPSGAVKRTSTCWPARWPGQSGMSSVMVFALGVSSRRATTVPTRQTTGRMSNVAPPMGVIKCDNRDFHRSLVYRHPSMYCFAPILRSSINIDEEREAVRDHHAPAQDLCRQIRTQSTPGG